MAEKEEEPEREMDVQSTDPFVDSSELLERGNFEQLRQRAEKDSYLFFRGLLPEDEVLRVREDLLKVVERHGWRQPGQNARGGRVDVDAVNSIPTKEMRTDIGVSLEMYRDVQMLESVHRLPHYASLQALYRGLYGEDVLTHPRHIVRMITPHRDMVPTPPHQDFPLIQGTDRFWTCWIPLGDCSRELGGLTILRGSHRQGYIPVQQAQGAGGISAQLCPGEEQWTSTDYRAGDVLTFPCYTVHRALPTRNRDEIRLSLDVRYQPASLPVEEKSLHPHTELTWEEIYVGWESDDLKYYWKKQEPELSPWDGTLMQPSRRIC
jgi:hypothetical protein